MGNCSGAPSEREVKLSKINTEKYQTQVNDSEDPEVKKAVQMVLTDSPHGGLTGFEKIAFIVMIQLRFKKLRNMRRAQAIASSNHIRSFSDKLAEGGIDVHTNKAVQDKLQELGKFKFDNHNVKDLGVEREHREL
jgi:hypothetical protein